MALFPKIPVILEIPAVGCLSQGYQACGTQVVNEAIQNCSNNPAACSQGVTNAALGLQSNFQVLENVTGISSMQNDASVMENGNTSTQQKVQAAADFIFNEAMIFTMIAGPALGEAADALLIGDGGDIGDLSLDAACGLSFSADTPVATPTGEQAISSLKVGDQVLAYDPQTHQTTTQTVQHLFINHDTDLVDVKLRADDAATTPDGAKPKPAANGQPQSRAPPQGEAADQQPPSLEETLHTTAKHPFLTVEQSWVQAGQLQPGMHVIRADGSMGVVEAVQVTPGAGTRYDLEVSHIHTFEVGLGQWVVHNCSFSNLSDDQINKGLDDAEALRANQKAAAGAIAQDDSTGAYIGQGVSGRETGGQFAPGIAGPYNSAPGLVLLC